MNTHLYSATVSNLSATRRENLLRSLPVKYYDCFEKADLIADCQGAACPTTNELGSGEIYFFMDATKANALRKWFGRRFKGRSKFARVIVPVQFCKDCGGAA
jgi:hypothetical protein